MHKKPSEPQLNEEVDQDIQPETYLNNISYFPAGQHVWRQQGPYVVCHECVLHHAVYVGVDKVMIGENEKGEPILRDRASI